MSFPSHLKNRQAKEPDMSRWVSITLTVASILVTIAGIATYVIKNRQ